MIEEAFQKINKELLYDEKLLKLRKQTQLSTEELLYVFLRYNKETNTGEKFYVHNICAWKPAYLQYSWIEAATEYIEELMERYPSNYKLTTHRAHYAVHCYQNDLYNAKNIFTYIPSLEECDDLVSTSEVFFKTSTQVEGFDVYMFNYRLANYSDFEDNCAYELRGLTFIKDRTGYVYCYPALNKFFNVNQTINWMYDDLKDLKIKRVQDKADGSLIQFIRFPNGKYRAKSKMSFTSSQAIMAQEIFDNDAELQKLIKTAWVGHSLFFELTSPWNQIVLDYQNTELKLIQARSIFRNSAIHTNEIPQLEEELFESILYHPIGTYNDLSDYNYNNVQEFCTLSLQEYLEKAKVETDIEGYVFTFENNQLAKLKTNWYISLHGLVDNISYQNKLIEVIVTDNIDDLLPRLSGEKLNSVKETIRLVQHKFNHYMNQLLELYPIMKSKGKKDFALEYRGHELFHVLIQSFDVIIEDVEEYFEQELKKFILYKTNSLTKAQEWLNGSISN